MKVPMLSLGLMTAALIACNPTPKTQPGAESESEWGAESGAAPGPATQKCIEVGLDNCANFGLCYVEAWNTGDQETLERVATVKAADKATPKTKTGVEIFRDKIRDSKKEWKRARAGFEDGEAAGDNVCAVHWRIDGTKAKDPETQTLMRGTSTVTHDGEFRMIQETIMIHVTGD